MKSDYSIFNTFINICSARANQAEINKLIELAHSYAYTYLKYRYKNLHNILLSEDLTLNELAIDAIAILFARDENGVFIKIKAAFEKWQPPIETEKQADFFLNRLVANSTEKYVSKLLRDSDPFFSKILNSITYLIEKHNYKKIQFLGTTFIVEDENPEKISCLPSKEFLDELPIELFIDPKKILCEIFKYIKEKTDKSPAIPLNALVQKIKKLTVFEMNLKDIIEADSNCEVDSIINNAMNATLSKMKESYLVKGKITECESSGIQKALQNITFDLRDGGVNLGLHKYFLEQFPELTFEDYRNKYQNIFEYLFKVLKKEITVQLN